MQSRKVHFAKIDIKGGYDFSDILLLKEVDKFITTHNSKELEISHLEDKGDYITGMFVATQSADIPPIHTPGDDDYSAVIIEEGKGFAYPNVFLYYKESKVLCYEVNRYGFSQKVIEFFFNTFSAQKCYGEFMFTMGVVLNLDPIKRTRELTYVNEVEIQIANPIKLMESYVEDNGSLRQIAQISEEMNATRSIAIKLTASTKDRERLSVKNIIEIISGFNKKEHIPYERVSDRLVIKGEMQDENDQLIEEVINVMINSLEGWFKIRRPKRAECLQVEERKNGILDTFNGLKKDIIKLT